MKFALVAVVLLAALYVANSMKIIASSKQIRAVRRDINPLRRLLKRQAPHDPYCDQRACAVPNCGKDFVSATLPGECCPRCVPWEYARSLGLTHQQEPQPVHDSRGQQPSYDPYRQQQHRVDVYIFGPDEGAQVSAGNSIYFDCEIVAPYNQNAQPRWSRGGNQPLPHKSQSSTLPGNRRLVRLTIPDATQSDAGRYECSDGTGNAADQASIDLQVTDGGYYPRAQPQPQPQPQPSYPNYPSYDPYAQPGYYPQPQPEPQPQPPSDGGHGGHGGQDAHGGHGGHDAHDGHGGHDAHGGQDAHGGHDAHGGDHGDDHHAGGDDGHHPSAHPTTAPPPEHASEGGDDEHEYPEDYSEQEK